MELALFGPLLLEDTSVFDLHRTGDEPDFTAFFHQASYPPVIIEFLYGTMKDRWVIDPPSPEHQSARMNLQNSVISVLVTKPKKPTSLTWRKSLASKETAMPGTGTSSS